MQFQIYTFGHATNEWLPIVHKKVMKTYKVWFEPIFKSILLSKNDLKELILKKWIKPVN